MKGKYAARTENRRVAEISAEANELRATLKQERDDSRAQIVSLEAEIRRLRADQMGEASRLAAEEVQRRMAEAEQERERRGMSDDVARHLMYQKDKFIMNACRYLSMTKGLHPTEALAIVLTWCTDDDIYGITSLDFIVKLGVPRDGWVGRTWQQVKQAHVRPTRKRMKEGTPLAISLDRAEQEGHPDIHPKHNPAWYPKIEYQGLEVVDEPVAG